MGWKILSCFILNLLLLTRAVKFSENEKQRVIIYETPTQSGKIIDSSTNSGLSDIPKLMKTVGMTSTGSICLHGA